MEKAAFNHTHDLELPAPYCQASMPTGLINVNLPDRAAQRPAYTGCPMPAGLKGPGGGLEAGP